MRLYDCILFRGELDLLQMRLEELADYDCTTVIVESPVTFRGRRKPLVFRENRSRFSAWENRIAYVVADSLPRSPDPRVVERAQRNCALEALIDAGPSDRVLIADVDEIPSRDALEAKPRPAVALQQNVCVFAVDWMAFKERTSVLTTAGYARENGGLAAVRDRREEFPVIWRGGWHFMRPGAPGCGEWDGAQLRPVDVDGRWPAMIREHRCPPEWFRTRFPVPAG